MTALYAVQGRNVLYLDTPLEHQLHKLNRLVGPGRVMGDSPDIHGRLMGRLPGSARPRYLSQTYGIREEDSFTM
jgi:hypothetical protein